MNDEYLRRRWLRRRLIQVLPAVCRCCTCNHFSILMSKAAPSGSKTTNTEKAGATLINVDQAKCGDSCSASEEQDQKQLRKNSGLVPASGDGSLPCGGVNSLVLKTRGHFSNLWKSVNQPPPAKYDHAVDEQEHSVDQWKELIFREIMDYEESHDVYGTTF
ncbi:Stress-activated protein kinase JNK [Trichinella pseudospiralis]